MNLIYTKGILLRKTQRIIGCEIDNNLHGSDEMLKSCSVPSNAWKMYFIWVSTKCTRWLKKLNHNCHYHNETLFLESKSRYNKKAFEIERQLVENIITFKNFIWMKKEAKIRVRITFKSPQGEYEIKFIIWYNPSSTK